MNQTGLPEHNSVNISILKRLPDYTVPQLTTKQHTTTAALSSSLLRRLLEIHVSSFRVMTCCGELVCLFFGVNAVIFKTKAGETAVSFCVRSSLNFTGNSKQTADPIFQCPEQNPQTSQPPMCKQSLSPRISKTIMPSKGGHCSSQQHVI